MVDFDIVGLGEPLIEFNQTRPGEPGYLQGVGGDTSNAIIAAARQGARCAYLTRIGADPFGEQLMDLWRAEGVATDGVRVDPQAHTGVYFVQHGADGHVFSYLRRDSAASRMQPADLDCGLVERARVLHVSGVSLAISSSACDTVLAAIGRARACGARVSLDSNLRLRLWPAARARAILSEAMRQADLFLPSLDDMRHLTGHEDPQRTLDWIRAAGAPGTVVLKLGRHGALIDDGARRQAVPGLAVRAVDATGAGDCFAGSLLARRCAGDDWEPAVRYANAAAALSTTGYGAVGPLPRPEAVRALLERAGG
ncbi:MULTISPECIES: sugar kinase [Bordetella]|uniref:2-dehydro-3-deoxygluconokinase n=1 Tax=Bordetella genomosp. 6 TaxID=463024 RepID=A0ABX4FGB9_9BORD|nr:MULTISPECIES: sugar kinase [Bordetella]AOB28178.1 2-dehydro-3-deoxygluconokinase [Bordetella bronchiseptica]AZW45518.1 sugar kinase [Bordetella bronchiseptica]KCV66456.1 carbohydrate kinase, PfkB family [Bordetella bronchiseptica 99-R-0433]MBN3266431.1 sugar kinase [Bordetella bronchiseptica]OZI80963.1 2-dehydro-3-deoxygluconokinase [Bordetella genomosp. 6]